MLIFLTNAKNVTAKTNRLCKKATLKLPNKMKLIAKFNNDCNPFSFKTTGFRVHQKFLESKFENLEHNIAIGFCRLQDASPKVEDIEDFKKFYLQNMPGISETISSQIGLNILVPYVSNDDPDQVSFESSKIENMIQTEVSSGLIFFKTLSVNKLCWGGPIIIIKTEENFEIIGIWLEQTNIGAGIGLILTTNLRMWYMLILILKIKFYSIFMIIHKSKKSLCFHWKLDKAVV